MGKKYLVSDAPEGAIIQVCYGMTGNYYRLGPQVPEGNLRPAWRRFKQGKTFLWPTNQCRIIKDPIEGFEEFGISDDTD